MLRGGGACKSIPIHPLGGDLKKIPRAGGCCLFVEVPELAFAGASCMFSHGRQKRVAGDSQIGPKHDDTKI
jgi:hypothetical protein